MRGMAIHLGRPLPDASRDRPGRRRGNTPGPLARACRPYLVLLPVGFTLPPPLPATRCALTAPFHPYRGPAEAPFRGGLLSVALSLGSPPPDVIRHRTSMEPGLSSPPCGGAAIRPSGARRIYRVRPASATPLVQGAFVTMRSSAASRPTVSASAMPSKRAGRKCRWKATSAAVTPAVCPSPVAIA
jgi:hypothetical protein